jgi:hypothetical protein
MKNSFADFLVASPEEVAFAKFIAQRIDFPKNKDLGLAA